MKRREFIAGLGGAVAWPLAARAQPAERVRRIGVLMPYDENDRGVSAVAAFQSGLGESGFVEGRNVAIEFRWGQNDFDRFSDLATDLVHHRVSVIVTLGGALTARAAKEATTAIPIVFGNVGDPVTAGLVTNLSRPSGNVTGISDMNSELVPKGLGLLSELVPAAMRFAVLVNPDNPIAETIIGDVRAAATNMGRQVEILSARTNREIDVAFENVVQKRADALVVVGDALYFNRRVQLVTLAAAHAVPAIYFLRTFAEAGGLMSYGSRGTEVARLVGIYTGRILKGEKPDGLPVMQPTRFEFVINLQTARTLGVEVPPSLLATADEVIE